MNKVNKVYIFLGIAFAIVLYFLTRKKKSSTVGITGSNGESVIGSLSTYVQNLLDENTSNTDTGNNSNTGTSTGNNTTTPIVVMGASEPINIRYYYQLIYLKWNGYTSPSGAIGFLGDGTILYYSQVEFKDGMYVDRQITPTEPIIGNEV